MTCTHAISADSGYQGKTYITVTACSLEDTAIYLTTDLDWWESASAWFVVKYTGTDGSAQWAKMTKGNEYREKDSTKYYYYNCEIDFDASKGLTFVRMKSDDTETLSFDNSWNRTYDQYYSPSNNLFKINGQSYDAEAGFEKCYGTWATYSA